MRVLSGTPSITNEIKENPDPAITALLTRHLEYGAEFNPEDPANLLTVFVIEPGDTLTTIDDAMNGCFLTNHYSRRRVGDAAFQPCFETLEERATVYEMLFIHSDEGHALVILIPKASDIDPDKRQVGAQRPSGAPARSAVPGSLLFHCPRDRDRSPADRASISFWRPARPRPASTHIDSWSWIVITPVALFMLYLLLGLT